MENLQLTSEEIEFKKFADTVVADYSIDDNNDLEIIKLTKYFNGDKSIEQDGFYLGKGLLVMGNVGSGKTVMMTAFQRMATNRGKNTFFQKNIGVLCSEYRGDGKNGLTAKEATIHKHKTGNWFFDELGLQVENISDYGNKFNLMEEIIRFRHIEFTNVGTITHFTTNLHEEQLEEFYDERTVSRLREMCNFITLTAPDRRQNAIPKQRLALIKTETAIPTAEEQEKIIIDGIIAHIGRVREAGVWLKNGNPDVVSDIHYNFLAERGILNFTAGRRTEIFDRACQKLVNIPDIQDGLSHRTDWNIFRKAIESKQEIDKDNFFRKKIIRKCKTELFKEFVMDIIKTKKDIYKILNIQKPQ